MELCTLDGAGGDGVIITVMPPSPKIGQGFAGLTRPRHSVIVLIVSSLSSSRRRRRIIGACFLENATAADHEKDHEFEV